MRSATPVVAMNGFSVTVKGGATICFSGAFISGVGVSFLHKPNSVIVQKVHSRSGKKVGRSGTGVRRQSGHHDRTTSASELAPRRELSRFYYPDGIRIAGIVALQGSVVTVGKYAPLTPSFTIIVSGGGTVRLPTLEFDHLNILSMNRSRVFCGRTTNVKVTARAIENSTVEAGKCTVEAVCSALDQSVIKLLLSNGAGLQEDTTRGGCVAHTRLLLEALE